MAEMERERERERKKKRKRDTIVDNKNKIDAASARIGRFFAFSPESSSVVIPRRAFFLFRSIFRRAASVAHPSTNRRGDALSRRRIDGNGKASGVIFDFSPNRKSASCRRAQFFQNSEFPVPPRGREELKNFEDRTETSRRVAFLQSTYLAPMANACTRCVFITRG